MWKIFVLQVSTWRGLINQVLIQVAAVFGALGMITFAAGLYEVFSLQQIDWKGFLEPMAAVWIDVIRPAMAFVSEPIVKMINLVFKVEVVIPPILLDYLGVGFTLVLSRWRGSVGGWTGGVSKATSWVNRKPKAVLLIAVKSLFFWPSEMVVMAMNLLFARKRFPNRSDEEIAQIRFSHLLGLSPALIALALVAANYFLLLLMNPRELRDQ